MKSWRKVTAGLLAAFMACAVFAGCGSDGNGETNTAAETQVVSIAEQKITADPVEVCAYGDKEAKIYAYQSEAELPAAAQLLATKQAIYLVNRQESTARIYQYTAAEDQLKGGEEIFASNGKEKTDAKNLYVQKNADKPAIVWNGKEKQEVSDIPGKDFAVTPDGKTIYVQESDNSIKRADFVDFQAQNATEVLKDFAKTLAARDEYLDFNGLIYADDEGFYCQAIARNGTKNGSKYSGKVYAFTADGQQTKVYDSTVGVPEDKRKYSKDSTTLVTKDYIVFATIHGFRLYNKADASYVGEFQTKDIRVDTKTCAYLGGNSFLVGSYGQKTQTLYRVDL